VLRNPFLDFDTTPPRPSQKASPYADRDEDDVAAFANPAANNSTPGPMTAGGGVEEIDLDDTAAGSRARRLRAATVTSGGHKRQPSHFGASSAAKLEQRSPQVKRFFAALRGTGTATSPTFPQPAASASEGVGAKSLHFSAHDFSKVSQQDDRSSDHSHIFQRRFKLIAESYRCDPADPTSVPEVHCEISRDLLRPAGLKPDINDAQETAVSGVAFTCGDEVSCLVNMGDSAHCRVIELRAAFSAEAAAQRAMCDATTSVALLLSEGLDAVVPRDLVAHIPSRAAAPAEPTDVPVRLDTTGKFSADDEDEAARSHAAADASPDPRPPVAHDDPPTASGDDVYDLGKRLVPHCDESARHTLNTLLSLCSGCDGTGLGHVARVLSHILQEADGQALSVDLLDFNAEKHWHRAQALGVREAEAKANGNLALCAQLRRELITALHDALGEGLSAAERASNPFTALTPARRQTNVALRGSLEVTERGLRALRSAHSIAADKVSGVHSSLDGLRDKDDTRKRDLVAFLADSDRAIAGILGEIDALYDRLELQVNNRTNRVKAFVKTRGSSAVAAASLHVALAAQEAALKAAEVKASAAAANAEALQAAEDLVDRLREHIDDQKVATLDNLTAERRAAAAQCDELYAELQACVGGWCDVLMKNAAREAEREAGLRQSIEDATERYHQADRDMYVTQLTEAEHRRKLASAELIACETILKKAATRMATLGFTASSTGAAAHPVPASPAPPQVFGQSHSAASRPSSAHGVVGGGGGGAWPERPATPQRMAAPRFAHQLEFGATPVALGKRPTDGADGRPPMPHGDHQHHHRTASSNPASNSTPTPQPRADVIHSYSSYSHALVPLPSSPVPPLASGLSYDSRQPSFDDREPVTPVLRHVSRSAVAGTTPMHAHEEGLPPSGVNAMHAAVDDMSAPHIVALFRKSAAVTERWTNALLDMDVEQGRELRGLRSTAGVWATVLPTQPLFKSLLEQLMDVPQRFLELEEEEGTEEDP
jgi:hypothetical protein